MAKFEAKALELAKEKSNVIKATVVDGHKMLEIKPGEDKPAFAALIDKNTIIIARQEPY